MELFDNHAHYNDEKFNNDRDEILKKVYESGVTRLISAGYSLESSIQNVELTKKYDFIYTIVGISPNDVPGPVQDEDLEGKSEDEVNKLFTESLEVVDKQLIEIEKLAVNNKKVVGIGEIGLDYYWNKNNKELQKQVFIKQIKLANKLNMPIIIHTRDAVIDTLDILKNVQPTVKPRSISLLPAKCWISKRGIKTRILHFFCRTSNI